MFKMAVRVTCCRVSSVQLITNAIFSGEKLDG
jgi:hypothetical protein